MSFYYGENGKPRDKVFGESRTKQAFKDETDINRILARFQVSGVMSHKSKYEATYGNFADFDFLEAQTSLNLGNDIFAALPSEVRREFKQSPAKFFKFVNDPANVDKLDTLLPAIAEVGDFNLDVSPSTPPGELVDGGDPGPDPEPAAPPAGDE